MSENVCICCNLQILDFGITFFLQNVKSHHLAKLLKLTPVDFSHVARSLALAEKFTGVKALFDG